LRTLWGERAFPPGFHTGLVQTRFLFLVFDACVKFFFPTTFYTSGLLQSFGGRTTSLRASGLTVGPLLDFGFVCPSYADGRFARRFLRSQTFTNFHPPHPLLFPLTGRDPLSIKLHFPQSSSCGEFILVHLHLGSVSPSF